MFSIAHFNWWLSDKKNTETNKFLPCSWCKNDVVSRPIAFSRLRHLARRFWNQTCNAIKDTKDINKVLSLKKFLFMTGSHDEDNVVKGVRCQLQQRCFQWIVKFRDGRKVWIATTPF